MNHFVGCDLGKDMWFVISVKCLIWTFLLVILTFRLHFSPHL